MVGFSTSAWVLTSRLRASSVAVSGVTVHLVQSPGAPPKGKANFRPALEHCSPTAASRRPRFDTVPVLERCNGKFRINCSTCSHSTITAFSISNRVIVKTLCRRHLWQIFHIFQVACVLTSACLLDIISCLLRREYYDEVLVSLFQILDTVFYTRAGSADDRKLGAED